MTLQRTTSLSIVAAVAALLATLGAACSDDPEGGTGGATSSSSTGGGASSSSSGMVDCGDTMANPANCGKCGHVCAPGQTCEAGVCTCGTTSVAFADVQTIFTQACATYGCHTGGMPKGNLNLSDGNSYEELMNGIVGSCSDGRRLVLPGDPSESYLIDKLLGVDMCFGNQMPGAPLPTAKIQVISDWICAGAMP